MLPGQKSKGGSLGVGRKQIGETFEEVGSVEAAGPVPIEILVLVVVGHQPLHFLASVRPSLVGTRI